MMLTFARGQAHRVPGKFYAAAHHVALAALDEGTLLYRVEEERDGRFGRDHRLLRRFSTTRETGMRVSFEEKARAAGISLETRRPRDQSPEAVAARRARTNRFVAELAAMPVLDSRSAHDIMDDLM
jgi:hypothetical protein